MCKTFCDQMLVEEDRVTFRAVLVGDSSVGKTSILNRFVNNRFNPSEPNTVGALYESYTSSRLGHEVEVQIWDTAGTEQYRSLTPVYFRQAAGAIIVYDITSRSSFASLETWLSMFRGFCQENAAVMIVANKLDLDEFRRVEPTEGREWAQKNNCRFAETSAQTGEGVTDLFNDLVDALVEQSTGAMDAMDNSGQRVELAKDGQGDKGSCC
jgi:small GTP-binding protein